VGINVVGLVLYGLIMNTRGINLLGDTNPFAVFNAQQTKLQNALAPMFAMQNQVVAVIEKALKDPHFKCGLHRERRAQQGATPFIAKVLKHINRFAYLSIIQSIVLIQEHFKPKKVSSRLHTLGVSPCAPNAFA
jgi:hypothetical protein